MRVLIDMNLTPRWVGYLIEAGHDAVHWSVTGSTSAKDREICDYCRLHDYVLLTNDLDFPQILAYTRDAAPSVILLRGQTTRSREPWFRSARGDRTLSAGDQPRRYRHP